MGDFYHSNDSASTDYSQKIEELENSKQFQDAIGLIREQMKNNLQWNVLRSFGIICAILSLILLRFAAIPLILLVVGLYYWPQYKKRKALFGDRIRSNDEIYLDDILSPVLKEVFPKASIKEDGSIPSEALSHLCPRSTDFLCFKELSFHDDKELTVQISMPIIQRLVTGHLMVIRGRNMWKLQISLDKCSLYVYRSISRVIFGWFRPRNHFFLRGR